LRETVTGTVCFSGVTTVTTSRILSFSYVQSIMTRGIIFWGNSPYSINIFRIQKRIIRIITNSGKRCACMKLFKKLKISPLYAEVNPLQVWIGPEGSRRLRLQDFKTIST
jgi:hypothetical protein